MPNSETIILILSASGGAAIIGGIIGAYLNHLFERKRELARYVLERREQQYKALLESALSFFEGWENKERKKQFMRSLYNDAPLYASDNVIRISNKFLESFNKGDMSMKGPTATLYRQLALEIRREIRTLGKEKKTRLNEDDIKVSTLH